MGPQNPHWEVEIWSTYDLRNRCLAFLHSKWGVDEEMVDSVFVSFMAASRLVKKLGRASRKTLLRCAKDNLTYRDLVKIARSWWEEMSTGRTTLTDAQIDEYVKVTFGYIDEFLQEIKALAPTEIIVT